MKLFTQEHEWIEVNGDTGTIGITDYAQKQLGDVVYVSLTKSINDKLSKGDDVAEIESVKSVSPIYMPVDGILLEFNNIFEDESKSGIVNEDPYEKGWVIKIKLTNESQLEELMNEEKYLEYINTL